MVIQLQVNGPLGKTQILEVCQREGELRKMTVIHLKGKIAKELLIKEDFRIVFRTKQMEESDLLSTYGIRHMSTIHTVLMLPGGPEG